MRELSDTVWQRRGVSWIWNVEAFATVANSNDIVSFQRYMRVSHNGFEDFSNIEETLVVSGLDASLDVLEPESINDWLQFDVKKSILLFQDIFTNEASLIFWIPLGHNRLKIETATDNVYWKCAPPHNKVQIEFGRLLWGDSNGNPQKIKFGDTDEIAGLYHPRIT